MTRMRLGVARVGTLVATIALGIWGGVKAGVTLIGATTVGDDFSQLVTERLPAWAAWLFATPWWVPALLATALAAFLVWLSWPRRDAPISAPPAVAPLNSGGKSEPPLVIPSAELQPRAIKDAIVVARGEFRMRFARNGKDARFYIEFDYLLGGIGSHAWSARERVFLAAMPEFSMNEVISIPLVVAGPDEALFFAKPDGANGRRLYQNTTYRARVVVLTPDGGEEYCYFIAIVMDTTANIVGEHMLNHIREWQGLPLPNGTPDSLFR